MQQRCVRGHSLTTCAEHFDAYLYGAGDEKIGKIIGKGKEAGRVLKQQFTRKTPGLSYLKEAVAHAVRTKGYLIGLDGRRLHCRSQHSALNTLLQSAGALVMKQACVCLHWNLLTSGWIHGQDYAFVANIHDEWQIECKPELAEEIGKEAVSAIREAGECFNFRCPLAGEFKVGKTWADTH